VANAEFSEYVAGRIRRRVKDPKTAEKLIPKDHGFGVQRVPLETRYYEAYNRPNVHLVDLSETPLKCVTETGLRTTERDYEFDIIVYATGFDAITGAFDHIDIRGTDGQTLRDKWRDSCSSYLGMMVHGFPNFLMPAGPQSGSASTNYPRGIETGVNWSTDFLKHVRERAITRFEPTAAAEARWTDHVVGMYSMMLMRKAKGWFTGYNSNVAGHEEGKVRYFVYNGGAPKYVNIINKVAADGYADVVLNQPLAARDRQPHATADQAAAAQAR
jgi:cation diffusion facilitator CzcD-associated flavoprotein CzcO